MDSGNFDVLSVDKPWLMLGDCLERMAEIPDGSVDAVICDLPFGTTRCVWDSVIPLAELWCSYRRIIKPSGAIVLFAAQPFTSALVMSQPKLFRYDWVWKKPKGTGHLNAKRQPMRDKEDILVFCREQATYHPQMTLGKPFKTNYSKAYQADTYGKYGNFRNDNSGTRYPKQVIEFNVVGTSSLHPTQKPVPLLEYLTKTYTNPGETILDNCFGSGTTGVACANTGRRFIGIERDPHYFDIGRRRINTAIAALQPAPQGGLFETELI